MNFSLARLKLAHKLLISGLAFVLPLAILLYFTVSGFQRQIRFAEQQVAGMKVLKPMAALEILVARRQSLAHRYLSGGAELRSDLEAIGDTIETAFGDVKQAESGLGQALPDVYPEWRNLKGAGLSLAPAASDEAHHELLTRIQARFQLLGEASNLILDPELESYYLMDVALLRMPGLYGALSQSRLEGRNEAAVADPATLVALRHDVSTATAQNRRRHPRGSHLQDNLPRALAGFETACGAGSGALEAGAVLWRTTIDELRALLEERAADYRLKQFLALVLTLGAAAFAGGLLLLVVRDAGRPLARVTEIAGDIAAGRLREAGESLSAVQEAAGISPATANGGVRDETLQLLAAFQSMTGSLTALLNQVHQSGSEVNASTTQMAASVKQLQASAAEQAASTKEVTATSKQIFATVKDLAESMQSVTRMASQAATLASAGMESLRSINATMQGLLEATGGVSAVLTTISEKAANINQIVVAITKIAHQTNLLSLNAAIEAEKAGKHAAGFTVVGLEVRRLADQTAVAALDIERTLAQMRAAVDAGVSSMSEYAARTLSSSQTVASITTDLGHAIEYTRSLEPHFEAVNKGVQMQAQAAGQILQAMQQISEAAVQTRDSLVQFSELAAHMRTTVAALQTEVARFSVT